MASDFDSDETLSDVDDADLESASAGAGGSVAESESTNANQNLRSSRRSKAKPIFCTAARTSVKRASMAAQNLVCFFY